VIVAAWTVAIHVAASSIRVHKPIRECAVGAMHARRGAKKDAALLLSRAGVRLAAVLNRALGRQAADEPVR